jgi:hypothetical protein
VGRRGIRALVVGCACLTVGAALLGSISAGAQSPADDAEAKEATLKAQEASPAEPAAPQPHVVRIGGLINDIQQLDLQSHSYNVDMYIWFKWEGTRINPAKTFEFLNAFELWGHILTVEYSKPVRLPDGSFYQVIRNQGKFNTKLPLEKYPFDTQNLGGDRGLDQRLGPIDLRPGRRSG